MTRIWIFAGRLLKRVAGLWRGHGADKVSGLNREDDESLKQRVEEGNIDGVRQLIASGVDVNKQPDDYSGPLHVAACHAARLGDGRGQSCLGGAGKRELFY